MSRIGNLSSRVFVGGLDPAVNESDLEKAFALFGEITNVMVMRDRENGRSRGFAFISFKDSQSSEESIARMHGVEIRGRCVTVRHAERERFLDDKNQRVGGGYARGRGGMIRNTRTASSEYSGYSMPISKTVYVTDDDKGHSRGSSYGQRRSPSPLSRGYPRADKMKPDYRDRSPHYRDERYPSRSDTLAPRAAHSYYDDARTLTSSRLSPNKELSAYIRSREYSPIRNLAQSVSTGSNDYDRGVSGYGSKSYRGRDSPEPALDRRQERARDYADDRRRSPDRSRQPDSYSRTSTRPDYGGFQKRDEIDIRDVKKSRDYVDSRRPAYERQSPSRSYRGDFKGARDGEGRSSWGGSSYPKTTQNSYGGWSRDDGRTGRSERPEAVRGRPNDVADRDSRPNSSRYDRDGPTSGGRGTQENWKARDNRGGQDHWKGRDDRASQGDWKGRVDHGSQSRDGGSYPGRGQSWKRGTSDRSFGAKREFQKPEYRGNGADYHRSQYRDEDRVPSRSAGLSRDSSPGGRPSGPADSQRGGRRY